MLLIVVEGLFIDGVPSNRANDAVLRPISFSHALVLNSMLVFPLLVADFLIVLCACERQFWSHSRPDFFEEVNVERLAKIP